MNIQLVSFAATSRILRTGSLKAFSLLRSSVYRYLRVVVGFVFLLGFYGEQVCQGQESATSTESSLAESQEHLADQLAKLESLLLRSADLESVDNPTRSALLQQAVAVSKQAQLVDTLIKASKNLSSGQLSEAVEKQQYGRDTLRRLLELLQSENREQRVREQRDQVRRWIEETDRLLRMQSSLRGRTEGGQDLNSAAEDQSRLKDKARQIGKDLGELNQDTTMAQKSSKSNPIENQPPSQNDSKQRDSERQPDQKSENDSRDTDAESNSADSEKPNQQSPESKSQDRNSEGQQSDGQKPEGQQSEGQQSEGQQSEGQQSEGQQSEGQQSESQQSQSQQSEGQQSQGQQSESQQSQSQQSQSQQSQSQQSQSQQSQSQQSQGQTPAEQPQTPTQRAQQQIQQAFENMQQAEKELKEAERDGAIEKQREAERMLKEAIEQLEQILNQLREEEVKRSLETLETRLRRMLEMQNGILEESNRLHEIAGEQPDRQILVRATALAKEQVKVGTEGQRALLLLQEEGSSAAFPEALTQVNSDIASSATRLESGDVGAITILIQTDIVQALEEMVEAVDRVRKENEEKEKQEKNQQAPGGGQMSPEMQPLIDQLAELRLIRTLQLRVNKRTEVLSKMLTDPNDSVGQAGDSELVEQLRELGRRQDSIENVTRNIAEGT